VDEFSSKSLPPTHSFVSLAAPSLAVTALKKAERDNAIVLRLVEMEGTAASTPVEFLGSKRRARPIDLLEAEAQPGEPDLLEVKPYAIRTVRLLLK
jgi:alpha-mannosidase